MKQLIEAIHQLETKLEQIKKQAIQEPENYKTHLETRQKLELEIQVLKKLQPVKLAQEWNSKQIVDPIRYASAFLQILLSENEQKTEQYYHQNALYNTVTELLDQYKQIKTTSQATMASFGKQLCQEIQQTIIYPDLVIHPSLRPYLLFNQWDQKFLSRVTKIYRMLETYQQAKRQAVETSYQELRTNSKLKNTLYNLLEDPQLLRDYFKQSVKDLSKNDPGSFQLDTCLKQNDFLKNVFGVSFDPEIITTSTLGQKLLETKNLWNTTVPSEKKQLADNLAYLNSQAMIPVNFNDAFYHKLVELDRLVYTPNQIPAEFLKLNVTQKRTLYTIMNQVAQNLEELQVPTFEPDPPLELTSYSDEEQQAYHLKRYRQQLATMDIASQWEEVMQSSQAVNYELFRAQAIEQQKLYDLGTYQYQDQTAKLWLCEYQYLIPVSQSGRIITDCCTKLEAPMDQQEKLCMYYSKTPQAKHTPSEMFAAILDVRRMIKQYGKTNTKIYYQTRKHGTDYDDRVRLILDPMNTNAVEYPLLEEFLVDRRQRELKATLDKPNQKSLAATIQAIEDQQSPIFVKSFKK